MSLSAIVGVTLTLWSVGLSLVGLVLGFVAGLWACAAGWVRFGHAPPVAEDSVLPIGRQTARNRQLRM